MSEENTAADKVAELDEYITKTLGMVSAFVPLAKRLGEAQRAHEGIVFDAEEVQVLAGVLHLMAQDTL